MTEQALVQAKAHADGQVGLDGGCGPRGGGGRRDEGQVDAVFDAEPRREVLGLQAFIQKRRVLTLMK